MGKSEISESERMKAAYALNLCTVSVSQIIDYRDLNIMEQEYEAILNNLNLENMPKDEALLNILKQLLDTITFFRIQEGDKQLFENEYKQKVKSAIWSAVPNLGLIVAGGNPVTMAVSLATQVGAGYMNYRKNKVAYELEHEKAKWQLERSAIEQFNGLRRELFDTAWRLADEYNFPDHYRLTERQIKQYNEILLDNDTVRKFNRLEAIQDEFEAYPPFWYFFGNAAHAIACDNPGTEIEKRFLRLAKEYYERYWKVNEHGLLRNDQIASSCALEFVDLMDFQSDRDRIEEYLRKAAKYSGKANDTLQLCVVGYLRIGAYEPAERTLRYLVNEGYNRNINAQILSGIYVQNHMNGTDADAFAKYDYLAKRVNSERLIPWIGQNAGMKQIQDQFVERQQNILEAECAEVFSALERKYIIKLNKIFPAPGNNREYADSYFASEQTILRTRDVTKVFASNIEKDSYADRLQDVEFSLSMIDILNEYFDALEQLDFIYNIDGLRDIVSKAIQMNKVEINALQNKLFDKSFNSDDFQSVQKYTTLAFVRELKVKAKVQIASYVALLETMEDFARSEANLIRVCAQENLPDLEVLLNANLSNSNLLEIKQPTFSFDLLGQERTDENRVVKARKDALSIMKNEFPGLLTGEKTEILYKGDRDFHSYFMKLNTFNPLHALEEKGGADILEIAGSIGIPGIAGKNRGEILERTALAVIDDKTFSDNDLVFTDTGVISIGKVIITKEAPYGDIIYDANHKTLTILNTRYANKNVDVEKLANVIRRLADGKL